MTNQYQRKQYFIDKSFQAKFIFKFCLIVIISSAFIGGVLFLLSQSSTTVAIENTKVIVKRTSDFILPIIIITVLLVTFFAALAVLILALFTSHRIAGPLFRLRREIDILKDGDLRRNFNIRAGDQLQPLAKSLSEMCVSLKGKWLKIKESLTALEEQVRSEGAHHAAKEKITQLFEDIQNTVNSFKT